MNHIQDFNKSDNQLEKKELEPLQRLGKIECKKKQ